MAKPHKCPFCGATDSVSKGVRKTKTMGVRRVRLCKGCGRKFTPRSQRPDELPNQEAEEQGKSRPEPQGNAEVPTKPEAPDEPAQALGTMFPLPDEQWTS